MDKEKVLDYVMNSPGNTNRAVLSGMLDEYSGGNSDFSIATVTLKSEEKTARGEYKLVECSIIPFTVLEDSSEEHNYCSAVAITSNGLASADEYLDIRGVMTYKYLFETNKYFLLTTDNESYEVTGKASIENITADGEAHQVVKIMGDCTIALS